jgi:1,4-dihydroxy-2-naphthoate octaprenyltransferase
VPEVTQRAAQAPRKRAGLGQVAATIFFGLLMVGRKDTWQKEGATVSFGQVVVGSFVGLAVVIAILVALVLLAMR